MLPHILSWDVLEEMAYVGDILAPLSLVGTNPLGSFTLLAPPGLISQGSGLSTILSADFCSAGGMYTNGVACKVLL